MCEVLISTFAIVIKSKLHKVVLHVLLMISVTSCNLWSDKPGVPHNVLVSEFNLTTSEGQGTSAHNITELWVYGEIDVLGVFPLPCRIPVLQGIEGESVDIRLLPGIRANGISSTRKPYPFYKSLDLDFPFVPGTTTTVEFNASYTDNSKFILAENFESANRFQASPTSTAEVVRTTDPALVFEGSASEMIVLSDSLAHVTSTTQEQLYDLHQSGPIWLEFNYRCNNSFAVGLSVLGGSNVQRTPIVVLNPSGDEWKKMYLDLGPLVLSTPDAFGYELTLDAIIDANNDTGLILVDNFKIVHFE